MHDAAAPERHFATRSRSKLGLRDVARFPDDTLFHRIARAVCRAECLPRKELYEAWEVARRARRRFRGGRVVDLACGHGLAAPIALLLDPTSASAVGTDVRLPASAPRVLEELARDFPRLGAQVSLRSHRLEDLPLEPTDLVLSVHACGALTDRVLDRAVTAHARVAVLPCCHDARTCDDGGLTGWLDTPLAIDVTRAGRLLAAGYDVHTQHIPAAITPKNRLLLGAPRNTHGT